MMKGFLVILYAILMVQISQAFETNMPYPEFGPCTKPMLDVAKGFWNVLGKPKNILTAMDGQNYLARYTTFEELSGIKCVRLNASSESATVNIFFYKTDGSKPGILSYKNVEETNGTLLLDGGKIVIVPLILDEDIISYHACSPNSTSTKSPLVAILVNTKNVNNPFTTYASNFISSGLTKALGKEGTSLSNYGQDCVFG